MSAICSPDIRKEFPVLRKKGLVYLDSASTTQKPQRVIDAISSFYENDYANVHRGVYSLSANATNIYEGVRAKTARFINAASEHEIVFTKGATEAINLVAATFGRENLRPGDEILISAMEHHSNIVPWQILCKQTGAKLVVCPIDESGNLDDFAGRITPYTKLVSIVHVSNVLGTVNDVASIVSQAHSHGIPVLIDGAQAAPHHPIDVRQLDCEFYVFSTHKMYGPTGVGILYGKRELLESMPPYQSGGDMIKSVTFEGTQYNQAPQKFEAGTPNIAGVVGFGAALDFIENIGFDEIERSERALIEACIGALRTIPGVRIIGKPQSAVVSFVIEGVHPHDIGTILDSGGVCIRAGHHCAQPLMDRLSLPATARASFGIYNNLDDIQALAKGLTKVAEMFS